MSMDVRFGRDQIDQFAKRLRDLDDPEAVEGLTRGIADQWVERAKRQMGKDTLQLFDRTDIEWVKATSYRGEAMVKADTPYAGFHNYGTRSQAPNRFWSDGMLEAERRANELGGEIGRSIERALTSGGSWNPIRRF